MIYPSIEMKICGAKEQIQRILKERKDLDGMQMFNDEIKYLAHTNASSEDVLYELQSIAEHMSKGDDFAEAYEKATDARPDPNVIDVAIPAFIPVKYDRNDDRILKIQTYENFLRKSEE